MVVVAQTVNVHTCDLCPDLAGGQVLPAVGKCNTCARDLCLDHQVQVMGSYGFGISTLCRDDAGKQVPSFKLLIDAELKRRADSRAAVAAAAAVPAVRPTGGAA